VPRNWLGLRGFNLFTPGYSAFSIIRYMKSSILDGHASNFLSRQ
jgi:hypothetical protein